MIARKLKQCLEQNGVKYEVIRHPASYTAQETAEAAHISGTMIAKTVIVNIDGDLAMAVLPANQKVKLQELREITGADDVSFANEEDFEDLFPGCETGAMPPFGNLYGMEVFVAPSLTQQEHIVFNAGSHRDLVKMTYRDFEKIVEPQVLSFT